MPQLTAYQTPPAYPTASVDVGIPTRTGGVPCLVPALRNERLPKDFKGPRKVPNYAADLQPGAWIESYEMAMARVISITRGIKDVASAKQMAA